MNCRFYENFEFIYEANEKNEKCNIDSNDYVDFQMQIMLGYRHKCTVEERPGNKLRSCSNFLCRVIMEVSFFFS